VLFLQIEVTLIDGKVLKEKVMDFLYDFPIIQLIILIMRSEKKRAKPF